MRKPQWLDKKVNLAQCRGIKQLLRGGGLLTVCEEALCPNISQCFTSGVATFMILGDICTRQCSFCAVSRGRPRPVDNSEPLRLQEAVRRLGLKYVVITSPTRDDLVDGGAGAFYAVVQALKSIAPLPKVEILIPDFCADSKALEKTANSGAFVVAHNLETVPSLYIKVRKGADYSRSLRVLETIKKINPRIFTKSGLMLGLGETRDEVLEVLRDLRRVGCDFLTLGQYLPPSLNHYPVQEYMGLDTFDFFAGAAKKLDFKGVKSSPYTRSSYLAHSFFD